LDGKKEAETTGQTTAAIRQGIGLIAVGSSTGGVPGVGNILSHLPEDSPPVLCVQHMPAAFTGGFAARLDAQSRITVTEAQGGEVLRPGLALVARGGKHLGVKKESGDLVAEVTDGPKVSGHRPSVDHLFWSCAEAVGSHCLGVILTGMGKDGGESLLEMRKAGGRTIAESKESCVIFGMPKTAIDLGGAELILPTESIPSKIAELLSVKGE